MTIYHTGPSKIEKIEMFYGVFDSVLFFSGGVYAMTQADELHVYKVEVEESEVLEVGRLYRYTDTEAFSWGVKMIADEETGIDEELAEELLLNNINIFDTDVDSELCGEIGWAVQKIQAQIARKLGFRFFEAEDEQGTYFAGDMLGREEEFEYLGNYYSEEI